MHVSADHALEVFATAMEENQMDGLRRQQVVVLPDEGEVWMTGDLHDHRRNFDKLVRLAHLARHPHRHLVLHEIIHGDHYEHDGAEGSWHMLFRAAELKCDYPSQVHFLLSNHDLAQIQGEGIMKGGLSVCEAFTRGVKRHFGDQWTKVNVAITEFLLSLPLAVRTESGLFCCHSLPTDDQIAKFDYGVFDRALTGKDYARRTGPVYQLIWGRNFTPSGVQSFAASVGADIILTGHQPQEAGYFVNGPRNLILASDHNQGVFLPIKLGHRYDMDELTRHLRRFVAEE